MAGVYEPFQRAYERSERTGDRALAIRESVLRLKEATEEKARRQREREEERQLRLEDRERAQAALVHDDAMGRLQDVGFWRDTDRNLPLRESTIGALMESRRVLGLAEIGISDVRQERAPQFLAAKQAEAAGMSFLPEEVDPWLISVETLARAAFGSEYVDRNMVDLQNVEDVKEYQFKDIDLLCTLESGGCERIISVEIKGDTKAHRTGNFFFETVSNEALNTQGCFLKSKAHLLFYYLLETDCLYIFPMKIMQDWFVRMQQQLNAISPNHYEEVFQRKKTHTVDAAGNYQHTTIGRCVNIEYTKKELKKQNVTFREIEEMNNWRCTLTDFCLKDI